MDFPTVLIISLAVLVALILGFLAHWRLRHMQLDDVARAFWGFTILLFPITGPIASFLALVRSPERQR